MDSFKDNFCHNFFNKGLIKFNLIIILFHRIHTQGLVKGNLTSIDLFFISPIQFFTMRNSFKFFFSHPYSFLSKLFLLFVFSTVLLPKFEDHSTIWIQHVTIIAEWIVWRCWRHIIKLNYKLKIIKFVN
jgi:hypothetical protein